MADLRETWLRHRCCAWPKNCRFRSSNDCSTAPCQSPVSYLIKTVQRSIAGQTSTIVAGVNLHPVMRDCRRRHHDAAVTGCIWLLVSGRLIRSLLTSRTNFKPAAGRRTLWDSHGVAAHNKRGDHRPPLMQEKPQKSGEMWSFFFFAGEIRGAEGMVVRRKLRLRLRPQGAANRRADCLDSENIQERVEPFRIEIAVPFADGNVNEQRMLQPFLLSTSLLQVVLFWADAATVSGFPEFLYKGFDLWKCAQHVCLLAWFFASRPLFPRWTNAARVRTSSPRGLTWGSISPASARKWTTWVAVMGRCMTPTVQRVRLNWGRTPAHQARHRVVTQEVPARVTAPFRA